MSKSTAPTSIDEHPSPDEVVDAERPGRACIASRTRARPGGLGAARLAFACALLLVLPATAGAMTRLSDRPVQTRESGPLCLCVAGIERGGERLEPILARVREAETLAEARRIATIDTRLAWNVLQRARWLAPGSESLRRASARLADYHARVEVAVSRRQIAEGLQSLSSLAPPRADTGCDYTGAEIIAILLGFVLGIIPGLILLVLLC